MKRTLLPLTLLQLLCSLAGAAVHAVLPGGSIQEKVDLAQPGDIVAISGGTYADDVTVNKAIRLVEMDGQEVTITGNVTFTGVANAPPFEGFTVGSPGKGIAINDTTGIVLKNIDARPGFGVVVNGTTSKAAITGGFLSQIEQNSGELTVGLLQITGNFNSTISAQKTVAFRTTVAGNVSWNSNKAWFGYSKAKKFVFGGTNSRVNVVSSVFDLAGLNDTVVVLAGTANYFNVINCSIKGSTHGNHSSYYTTVVGNQVWSYIYYFSQGISMSGVNNELTCLNNYISLINVGYNYGYDTGDGVRIYAGKAVLLNNIIEGAQYGITAGFGNDMKNNFFSSCSAQTRAGVIEVDSLAGDPLFVPNDKPKLQAASPCINSGVSDPIFNDLDGTRNDIGPLGGCLFDPQGWTTTKPVVISFDLAPQQLLRGVDTQVNLTKGLAVGQP